MNFFKKSLIQANIWKVDQNIPLAAFQFWWDKKIQKLFDIEVNKFLYSDLSLEISEYQTGIIPFMIAIIRHKKAIGLFPRF